MRHPHIKVLQKTEDIDGVGWRLLPKAVECDGSRGGHRHWIPETKVVWIAGWVEDSDERSA